MKTGSRGNVAASAAHVAIALAIVYVVWGSTYLAIRVAVETLPPFGMAALRFTAAGGLLLAFAALRRERWPSWREIGGAALVGMFLLVGGNGCVVWASQHIPSGLTALLVASVPLWVLALEALMPGATRPTRLGLVGIVLGFAGVAVLMAPGFAGVPAALGNAASGLAMPAGGPGVALGAQALVLFGSLLWAMGTLLGRHVPQPSSGAHTSAWSQLAAAIGMVVLGALSGEPAPDWAHAGTPAILALVYLVVFGSVVGFSAYTWLIPRTRPELLSTYAYVNPVVAVALGSLLASEPLGPTTLGGAALIVGAVAIVIQAGRRA